MKRRGLPLDPSHINETLTNGLGVALARMGRRWRRPFLEDTAPKVPNSEAFGGPVEHGVRSHGRSTMTQTARVEDPTQQKRYRSQARVV